MFVRSKMDVINIKKNTFSATILKFSPYRSENFSFVCGKTHVTLKTMGDEDSKKQYDCDLFGCGFQAITTKNNPFRHDTRYQVCNFNFYTLLSATSNIFEKNLV